MRILISYEQSYRGYTDALERVSYAGSIRRRRWRPASELPRIPIPRTWVNNLAMKFASYGGCKGSGDIVEMGY
jgi:hypothetical protein